MTEQRTTLADRTQVYPGHREIDPKTGMQKGYVVLAEEEVPAEPGKIFATAKALAERLCEMLGQQSFTVQTPDAAFWTSYRAENCT